MEVTVRKIMELDAFAQATTLLAGHAGIDKTVNFITVSETPDFYEWVTGGEFVLTTLFTYEQHRDLLIHNYTELAKRGVIAVGVKVNRFVETVPPELIRIADQYQMPLFAIHRQAKFREIIQTVTAELNNYQTNILLELEANYKELAKIALASGDYVEYLQRFGRRKGGSSLYCCRGDLKLLGTYQKSAQSLGFDVVKQQLEQYIASTGDTLQPADYENLHIYPCISRNQVLGYLVIADEEPLSERHKLMATQLATFLTMKLIDQLEAEQKMLIALLDELLYKRNLNEQELQGRLELHGLKYQQRYRVMIIQNKNNEAAELSLSASLTIRCCNKIKEIFGPAILINKTNEIVIIVSNPADDGSLPNWLKQLRSELAAEIRFVIIGIGPAVVNAIDIRTSYQVAENTMRAGAVFGQSGLLYHAHFLEKNLLQRTIGTPEEIYLTKYIIQPLLEQDKRHNTLILPTIEAMIFADELEQAAEALFVHTNTVRYRLNKIKTLTGYDFFTAWGRYVITTAYLVYCYQK